MTTKRKLISFDWAIKRLLRSKANFEILEGFLSELLFEDIKVLEVLESESNKENRRNKSNRLDIKVKNSNGEIIIIEIQYSRELDYLQRLLYAASKVVTEHIDQGKPYSEIKKVISISILYFDFGDGDDYIYHGKTSFTGIHSNTKLKLDRDQENLYRTELPEMLYPEYYLIKVNNFDDIAKNTLDEWIYFLKKEEIKDEFKAKGLDKALKELDYLKMSEKEKISYDNHQKDLRREASLYESTYVIGQINGRIEGIEEGIEKGIEKGVKKEKINSNRKIYESKIEIAKNLLDILDDETISKKTELPIDEITKLRKK